MKDDKKEELRKKFLETCCYTEMESESVRYPNEVFDFFYAEIEATEKIREAGDDIAKDREKILDERERLKAKISHLEELLKAADDLLQLSRCGVPSPTKYLTASEKYQTLKNKQ